MAIKQTAVMVRMPIELKAAAVGSAHDERQSLNAWICWAIDYRLRMIQMAKASRPTRAEQRAIEAIEKKLGLNNGERLFHSKPLREGVNRGGHQDGPVTSRPPAPKALATEIRGKQNGSSKA